MKIQFSLPTDEGFFNRYATLTPTLSKLGIIAQCISALTEVGIFYSLIFSRTIAISPNHANTISIVGAIIGTAFLEIGLRKFTPYSVKAFIYKRFSGLDLAMTIFILLVTIGLFTLSGTLSFQGSKEMVKIAKPIPILATTNKIDTTYQKDKAAIQTTFSLDSATIAKGYIQQLATNKQLYKALVEQQQSKLNQYQRKEQRTGLSYQSKKEAIRGKIASLDAENATKKGNMEALQATEIKALINNRKKDLATIESRYLAKVQQIETDNTMVLLRSESTTLFYGNGLAWFTIICLCVFLFSVVIEEIHKKGSGIKQVAIPNQYHFSESVVAEFMNMINEKINYKLRTKINEWAAKTPPPPLPTAPPNLYDLEKAKQQRLVFEIEENDKAKYYLSSQLPQITPVESLVQNGNGVLKNGANGTATLVKEKPIEKTLIRKSLNDEKVKEHQRICEHCKTAYIYRHHKQKYCCDKCRIMAWEQRTGKELKKKKKK